MGEIQGQNTHLWMSRSNWLKTRIPSTKLIKQVHVFQTIAYSKINNDSVFLPKKHLIMQSTIIFVFSKTELAYKRWFYTKQSMRSTMEIDVTDWSADIVMNSGSLPWSSQVMTMALMWSWTYRFPKVASITKQASSSFTLLHGFNLLRYEKGFLGGKFKAGQEFKMV